MDSPVFHSAQPAKTGPIFRNPAVMDAQTAENAVICSGRIFREAVSSSAVSVNCFNLRPDPIKMGSDTVGAKTDGI
jgi:hypothetical protein